MTVLNLINGYMPLKPSLVGNPDIYLIAKLKITRLDNGIWAWGRSPSKYVAQAVKNCAKHLTNKLNNHFCLPQQADNPFPYDYCPELDLSDPLDPECSSFYQHLIGVMRWMVELGCIDIGTEVSLLSSNLAYPCEGHLKTPLHMMSYLSHKHNKQIIFYPTYLKIDMGQFPQFNWNKIYGDVEEAIPVDMPEPLGKDIDIRMMYDSDHAGDKRTRHSCTGFLIFVIGHAIW
jgi:hypothetical protein